jgi:hypothetical protein
MGSLDKHDLYLRVPMWNTDDEEFVISRRQDGERLGVTLHGNAHIGLDMGDDVADALSDYLRAPVRLVRIPDDYVRQVNPEWAGENHQTAFADSAPIQLASSPSLDDFANHIGKDLDTRRYRPNIVLERIEPWREDKLRVIKLGSAILTFGKPTVRCEVPNVNPDTGQPDLELVAALARFHKVDKIDGTRSKGANFGWNLTHTHGEISLGDDLEIIEEVA